jgi:phage baseplate assembly protein W
MTLAGAGEGLLAMNYNIADQFADNLRNLLLTNWGERLGHYQFGANLRPLTTEFASQENFDNQAIERIRNAVNEWMPFVTLGTFESSVDRTENKNTAVILIKITYSIPAIEVIDRALQIVLYVI